MKKKGSRRQKLLTLLAVLAAGVLIFSLGQVGLTLMDYRRGAEEYDAAARMAGLPSSLDRPNLPAQSEIEVDPLEVLAATDLEALRTVNSEVVGWMAIPDTVISYPVLQGSNNRYYLNHTWTGERVAVGSIFMEYTASPDFSDFNTILYGHRMNNDSMFGPLRSYLKQDFWLAHPTVYLVTDAGVQAYDIFAAFEVGVHEVVYRLDLIESGLVNEFIRFSMRHSAIDTGITPTAEDKILTLSTCTGRGHDTRWVVQAVLRPEDPFAETPEENPEETPEETSEENSEGQA